MDKLQFGRMLIEIEPDGELWIGYGMFDGEWLSPSQVADLKAFLNLNFPSRAAPKDSSLNSITGKGEG